jgi:hypothetical protein
MSVGYFKGGHRHFNAHMVGRRAVIFEQIGSTFITKQRIINVLFLAHLTGDHNGLPAVKRQLFGGTLQISPIVYTILSKKDNVIRKKSY